VTDRWTDLVSMRSTMHIDSICIAWQQLYIMWVSVCQNERNAVKQTKRSKVIKAFLFQRT